MARTQTGPEALRDWREAQTPPLSHAELASDVGISPDYIRKFENRSKTFSIPVAIRLAQRTGLGLALLLTSEQMSLARQLASLLERQANGRAA